MRKRKPNPINTEEPLHFVRQWREYHGMTQAQLIEVIGGDDAPSISSISQIENGKQWPSKDMAIALSKAFGCTVADLFSRNPLEPPPVLFVWEKIPEANRDQALKVLQAFERISA